MEKFIIKYWIAIIIIMIIMFHKSDITALYKLVQYYLSRFESFRSSPYWDYKQWSWGYGTKVPDSANDVNQNPGGKITKVKAIADAFAYILRDKEELGNLIKVKLSPAQWAALLSFSYNLGIGNAKKIIDDINNRNYDILGNRWITFNKAGGVVKPFLTERRKYEWQQFISNPA